MKEKVEEIHRNEVVSDQDRIEQRRISTRENFDSYLFYFHKHRWTQITEDIRQRIRNAPDDEARTEIKAELDAHYKNQYRPETSRAALLAEIDNQELPPPGS